jgi:hypothetical protein
MSLGVLSQQKDFRSYERSVTELNGSPKKLSERRSNLSYRSHRLVWKTARIAVLGCVYEMLKDVGKQFGHRTTALRAQ